ncbi:hypothetical protein TrVE_jg7975 [Triparma verrucosa]|uniref:Uncharacterized protein n=2 Tax=Triparma TaxID=722752 RepID=A0A9W7ECQ7_9STRA|nr:hypothetical protein TrST_g10060 [Triparma strigata]GMH89844.1 hypothetical protein TrVE_jg7975 [Triparma verrucosa]
MSSLNATQADGYYHPPSYIESGDYKKKSVSQHAGSKGTNQSQLYGVVRFELPFKCVCTSCEKIIGKGTRFNAKKDNAGEFYTTKIYKFTFKCYECKNPMVLRTNPEKADYDFVSGIRRKVETWDTEAAGSLGVFDMNNKSQLHSKTADPIGKLERDISIRQKQTAANKRVSSLLSINDRDYKPDADNNALLRKTYRKDRKEKKRRLDEGHSRGLAVELLDEKASDVSAAKKIKYNKSHNNSVKKERRNFLNIRSSSIFGDRSTKQTAMLQAAERKNGIASTPSSLHTSASDKEKSKKKSKSKPPTATSGTLDLLTSYLSD